MAVTVIFPFAAQRVVAVLFGQRLVIRQGGDDGDEFALERLAVWLCGCLASRL